MEFKKMLFVCVLACMTMAPVAAVDLTVDFDGGDCSREFTVSQYDVYYLKADPNPLTSGGAASCTVRFRTSSAFNIYVQSVHVQDCTAKLFFYDNDNTQKYPSQTLSCIPTVDSGGTFKTQTGNLIVRLEKGSGSTKAYSFTVVLTTIEGQSVSDSVADTAGGGVGTGAIIGIAVGVVAFLIIIIAVVCFFVCRQMAQQKEEKMRQQPSIFATAASDPSVVIEREGDRQRNREPIPSLSGSYSRRHRPYDPPEENYQQLKLPEPKPNGILKGSQRRSRRRTQGEDSGHDNPGYSASVSSTDDSCDFDFASYQNSKISGLPQKVKNFSMDPDPSRARRERSERGRRERPSSQTSDSSIEDGAGFTNKAFTDESGRSQSLGRAAGRRRFSDDDETATNYTRSTRTDRSLSPSRTENSSDTGVTTGSRFERNPNAASIRRSRSRSHSTNRKQRHHHHHHDHSDQSSQGSHGSHNHHGHHGHRGHHGSHRSRSREKKKSPNLPIFDEVKKMQKAKK